MITRKLNKPLCFVSVSTLFCILSLKSQLRQRDSSRVLFSLTTSLNISFHRKKLPMILKSQTAFYMKVYYFLRVQ